MHSLVLLHLTDLAPLAVLRISKKATVLRYIVHPDNERTNQDLMVQPPFFAAETFEDRERFSEAIALSNRTAPQSSQDN